MIHTLLLYVRNLLTNIYIMTIQDYANYFLTQRCGGDVDLAMKVVKNSATLALEEDDVESFEMETEAYQALEVIKGRQAS